MTTPAPSFTPGPWEWHLSHDGVSLRTPNRGQLVIFDCGGRVTGHGLRFSKRHDRDRAGLMYFARELVPADQRNRTGFVTIDNPDARLIAAAPSLYAYAKAVQIRKALSDALIDELTADSRKPSDASNAASEAFQSHLAAMGWDRKQFAGDFLETYRAAALAQAEGRNP